MLFTKATFRCNKVETNVESFRSVLEPVHTCMDSVTGKRGYGGSSCTGWHTEAGCHGVNRTHRGITRDITRWRARDVECILLYYLLMGTAQGTCHTANREVPMLSTVQGRYEYTLLHDFFCAKCPDAHCCPTLQFGGLSGQCLLLWRLDAGLKLEGYIQVSLSVLVLMRGFVLERFEMYVSLDAESKDWQFAAQVESFPCCEHTCAGFSG